MEKVLKRRELNRQTLEQYVLDESEQFEVLGPRRMPVYRQKREFTWYVRDGLHVRSPVRFDGVTVGDAARKEYEDNWVATRAPAARAQGRQRDKDEQGTQTRPNRDPAATADDPAGPSARTPIPTPRFVSEAYFMDFKFEPGNYYLAGREQLEGQHGPAHRVLPDADVRRQRRRQGRGERKEQSASGGTRTEARAGRSRA